MRTATFPGGLRAQIVAGLSAMLLATLALGGLVVHNTFVRSLLDERRHHAQTLARTAVSSDGIPPTIEGVTLLISDGKRSRTSGDPLVIDAMEASRPPASLLIDGKAHLVVEARDGERVARVALEVDSIEAAVANSQAIVALFAGVSALVVLVFGTAFLTFLVIRPLRAINVATERAAEGDLASPITVLPRNEFGNVASSFNRMLVRLQESREELERKVKELERTNRELETARSSLVRSEKLASVGQLAAGIAHEIGNPLAALSGYNELLLDGDLAEDARDDVLRRSATQLERIRGVIRSLLDFSREDGPVVVQPTDLAACVDEAVNLARALPRARDVELVIEGLDGAPVCAARSQVVQVVLNLCINALDAVSEGVGSRVTVRRRDEGQCVQLIVEDDGPGVPEDARARIFDPFFTTKDPGEGTGLGLAISARIMESFEGELELESPEKGGARFILSFRRWGDE